jgi:hypothetical protein
MEKQYITIPAQYNHKDIHGNPIITFTIPAGVPVNFNSFKILCQAKMIDKNGEVKHMSLDFSDMIDNSKLADELEKQELGVIIPDRTKCAFCNYKVQH